MENPFFFVSWWLYNWVLYVGLVIGLHVTHPLLGNETKEPLHTEHGIAEKLVLTCKLKINAGIHA